MYFTTTMSAGPFGPGPNPNVTPWIFLQRRNNPNHNHVLYYNHECWPYEYFYNDAITLITTMYFTTTMSAGPFWAQGPTLM